MANAEPKRSQLSVISRLARKPWYLFWKWLESAFYAGRDYTVQFPYGRRVFTPWFSEADAGEFQIILKSVRASGEVMQSVDRAYVLYQFVKLAAHLPGNMAECGVYKGASAQIIASVIERHATPPVYLDLFDTFNGIPDSPDTEAEYHRKGAYADTSLKAVQQRLHDFEAICRFYPGAIPDSFEQVSSETRYSFVNIDLSSRPANQACLEWFWPRLSPGGVLFINDYGMYPYRYTTRQVVDTFFATHSNQPFLTLPTGQAAIIKRQT